MKEIKLSLVPQPGAKPEFLATLKVVDPSPMVAKIWDSAELSADLVLDGYTREGWAWKPNTSAFQSLTVESTDGRNKLPGFVSYLQQRQKASFGRFGSKGLVVISYVQKKQANPNRMECRICLDLTKIPECSLKPKVIPASKSMEQKKSAKSTSQVSSVRKKGSGAGLLGKLVGAQKRTNQHVIAASAPRTTASSSTAATAVSSGQTENASLSSAAATSPGSGESGGGTKSATEVMNEFRQSMESKMLDFDIAPEQELRVSLSLPDYTADLLESDKPKITMEILKYMVYEAAEEVNEEWIAHKEPSEFMDEVVICVYKEGAAPPEVLEEINKAELPDEVRGQQRAIQEERMKQMNQAEQRKTNELMNQAHAWNEDDNAGDDEMAALNKNKRDRRTIEDYEREKKRGKTFEG